MEVGKIIKEQRTSKNLPQEDLANEFFVSRQLISKWENGKSYPDVEQLLKLSDFFSLTLDELMRGDKKMMKKLNLSIKKKQVLFTIIGILSIFVLLFSYLLWSNGMVQLKASDIEIVSVKVDESSSIKKINKKTGKTVELPADVSYTIKYKIKTPFIKVLTSDYLEQMNDDDSLYIDLRGKKTLFPSEKVYTLRISSDAKLYSDNKDKKIDDNFVPKKIGNKDIRILDIGKYDGSNFSSLESWLLIYKSKLK